MPKIKKKRYYAIYSKSDNFFHGAFPLSEEGYEQARTYIEKISNKSKKSFYIKEK